MKQNKAIVFATCFLAYTSIYIARLNLTVASPELQRLDILDVSQIGICGGLFSVVYAIGRLLNGTVSDSKPPYLMICTGLALAGISNIIISFFPPFLGIVILWGVNAFSQSMLWSSVLCIISSVYEGEKAKKMTSYTVASVAVGNILGIIINTYLITKFGLKYAFIVPGILTILFCISVFFVCGKYRSRALAKVNHIPMLNLLKTKSVIRAVIPAMCHGVMKDNIGLWMTAYFVLKYNVKLNESAYYVLFIPVIGFAGRLLFPAFYRLCKNNEDEVSAVSFIICIAASVPLCLPMVSSLVAMLCLGTIYAAVSMINTSLLSVFPLRYQKSGNVASVSGIMDFCTYLGAGIGSLVYGFLIKSYGFIPMYISFIIISTVSIIVIKANSKSEHTVINT